MASLLFVSIHDLPGAKTPDFLVTWNTAPATTGLSLYRNPDMKIFPNLKNIFLCDFFPTRTQLCIASGPGRDMFESTWIIAERQFKVGRMETERISHIYFLPDNTASSILAILFYSLPSPDFVYSTCIILLSTNFPRLGFGPMCHIFC